MVTFFLLFGVPRPTYSEAGMVVMGGSLAEPQHNQTGLHFGTAF